MLQRQPDTAKATPYHKTDTGRAEQVGGRVIRG